MRLSRATQALEKAGLNSIPQQINLGELDAVAANTEFHYARAEALWTKAQTAFPELSRLSEMQRHNLVREFQDFGKTAHSRCEEINCC